MVRHFRGRDKRPQPGADDVENVVLHAAEDVGEQAVDDETQFILYWLAIVFVTLGVIGGIARVF